MLRSAAIIVLWTAGLTPVIAAPQASSRPQILSTQRGITDGRSDGTELHTGPLSHQGVFATQPIAAPYEQPANGSTPYPYIVAPYIQVPGFVPQPYPPRPTPRLR